MLKSEMTRLVPVCVFGGLFLWSAVASPAFADATNATPAFSEVYGLVRTHLRGLSEAELEQAALEGLLTALGPRVSLGASNASKPMALLSLARVLEENVAYYRIAHVSGGLAQAVVEAHRELSRTGKVVGLVLDLRYATGDDYAAASDVAALFLKSAKALLDWGAGVAKVEPSPNHISLPVAMLVNRATAGAAEALAAALREGGVGLILGARTGGFAAVNREFTLQTGQKLLIAASPVKLADGTELSPQGIKPDIEVAVSKEDEKAYFADPYRELAGPAELALGGAGAATNQVAATRALRRPRPTEADLVRARREGLPLDGEFVVGREAEPAPPVLRDPALARAVDLLKGLAIVRQTRS
jgi:hypothetical protein